MSDKFERAEPFPSVSELLKLSVQDRKDIVQLLHYLGSTPYVPKEFERIFSLVPEWRC